MLQPGSSTVPKQHGYRWTDEAKRYFNRTASVLDVFVGDLGDRLPEESSYEMKMMKGGCGCVGGGGRAKVEEAENRTLGSRSATSEGQQRTKSRLAVSILRLVDPGELHVTLQQHATGIERMKEKIQNVVEDKEPGDKTDWKKCEYCLVFPTMVSKRPDENGRIASTLRCFLAASPSRCTDPAFTAPSPSNINNRLGQYGYVHLEEKFKPPTEAVSVEEELQRYHQSFDKFLKELDVDMKEEKPDPQQQKDDSLMHLCGTYQDDITDEHTPIYRWLPAKPIEKIIFVGKPSYVDNNGVIYLEQEPVATDKFYLENEPCMAKFHQDNTFYHAIARKAISCRRYKVQFIDYGNIEVVDIADLHKNVNSGRVPIQMNRYRLKNVAPKKVTPGRRKSSSRCTH
ncbi:hypothetical protein pipiens_018376 [Culex pipiens pipiens]|uniref:Tudor domain-containing protein n=1 Tax=Culex pipiens pipiens TaxID=38569 RepID=A0ABD1CC13_CULPP